MEGLVLLEPTELYNMLQQASVYSNLSDNNYLLLIDARNKDDYNESHIVTAKKAPKNKDGQFFVPFDSELECRQNVVVYDSNTCSVKETTEANDCGSLLWEMGSRNKVYILKGGYEEFSALYPFLRTQKIIFMPKELDEIKPYPAEIITGFLYLGDWRQGNASYVQKDLKIKAHINCCVEAETFFPANSGHLLHIQCDDSSDADLSSKFEVACKFLDSCQEKNKPVLVFSNLAISRSAAIVMAYLIYQRKITVEEAFNHVKKCSNYIQPVQAFMDQLKTWSAKVLGK
ncbi:serine/threonine/tyrosine-interacting-like protein 1 [Mya arenaria]|uniref:serine/threonine/tyrosine-interacting-like protein 1 n=1 Tax=Mya arenaria TaxID=6604 RepID=UPI0022E740FB|nr:serine/threonine/tyrosine-interacting-like protein 1 [Mya arenaria]XP_052801090.1 serine/threonine/tyrosine-interacting-like protein 1 [Mya arenaria]